MKHVELIDLIRVFCGAYYIFETECDESGRPVSDERGKTKTRRIATHRSTNRVLEQLYHRSVHDFNTSADGGIEIFLDMEAKQ